MNRSQEILNEGNKKYKLSGNNSYKVNWIKTPGWETTVDIKTKEGLKYIVTIKKPTFGKANIQIVPVNGNNKELDSSVVNETIGHLLGLMSTSLKKL